MSKRKPVGRGGVSRRVYAESLEPRTLMASAATVTGDWATQGGTAQRTGYVAGRLNGLTASERWNTAAALGNAIQTDPVVAVAAGQVFASNGIYYGTPTLHSFSTADGHEVWSTPLGTSSYSVSGPSYADGRVYVQKESNPGTLWAINATTGASVWSSTYQSQGIRVGAPAADSAGVWIFGGYYGGIYGYNSAGNQTAYSSQAQVWNQTPALTGDSAYLYAGSTFSKFDRATGKPVWATQIPGDGGTNWGTFGEDGNLAALDGKYAYLTGHNAVHAINLSTGAVAWVTRYGDNNVTGASTPALANGLLYVSTSSGVRVYAADTGAYLNTIGSGYAYGQPVVTDDALIVCTNTGTNIYSLDGTLRQSLPVQGTLALAGNTLYVGADNVVHAYAFGNTVTGTLFNDANGNGVRDETAALPAGATFARVFVDLNANNVLDAGEPSARPDATGAYAITGVPDGSHATLLDLRGAANYPLFGTGPTAQRVTVAGGVSAALSPIGLQARPYVFGRVMLDGNGNNVVDTGDTAAVDVTVYVDANNNAAFDAGESYDVTDTTGYFGFNLPAGNYAVRAVLPSNAVQVLPAGNAALAFAVGASTVSAGTILARRPSGGISGFLYNDANGNGVRDSGEGSFTAYGTSVYLDLNNNNAYDSGEPYAYTGTTAKFDFTGLTAGTYALRLDGLGFAGVVQTTPAASLTFTLAANGSVTTEVGVRRKYTVTGFVVNDANGNGVQDAGETGRDGGLVYVDANNNSKLDAGETSYNASADGYFFTLSPGTYVLRQVLPAGYVQTSPTNNNGITVTVTGQETATLRPGNFLRYQSPVVAIGSISGTVFVDENLTEERDAFEAAKSGVVVYVDANNNGTLDSGEKSTVSGTNGAYTLSNLAAGNYVVRVVAPANFMSVPSDPGTVSLGSGQTLVGIDQAVADYRFAVVSGRVFYDANSDGVFNEGDDNLSADLYVDTNNNGYNDSGDKFHASTTTGFYSLKLPATGGTYVLRLDTGSDLVNTTPKTVTLTPAASAGYTVNFGLAPKPTASTLAVSGTVYNDANKNYKRDSGEAGLNLVHVYVDLNNNGQLDDADYATYTNASGYYNFPTLPATGKAAAVRVVLPAGYTQKYPNTNNSSYPITLTPKASITAKDFGLVPGSTPPPPAYTASVSGTVFNDADKSGTRAVAEAGLSGVTVFADLDNDGVLDSNEARATSNGSGAYTLVVPVNPGTANNVVIRSVLPSGYAQQLPAAGYALNLAPGSTTTAKDFGLYKPTTTPPAGGTASLAGTAFNDNNKNAKYDTGDGASRAISVFLDLDNDGVLDSNEKSVLTDSSGKFTFTGLAAGTYHVRRVMPSGYTYSTTKIDVTLTSGQAKTGLLIGTKKA